jgi:N6-adenosine-specific RNA methylase IME4
MNPGEKPAEIQTRKPAPFHGGMNPATVEEIQAAGGYSVILADPAWGYRNKTIRGGAAKHYPTMTPAQVARLRVGHIAAHDCALFLWVTWPTLNDALAVIGAWGFEYKTCAFAWVKVTSTGKPATGLGHYTRANTEPCLLATRGRVHRVDLGVSQVILDETLEEESIIAPRGEHSAKPPEVRNRIVRLLGDVPRVELFARERVEGWDAWGNEIESDLLLNAA